MSETPCDISEVLRSHAFEMRALASERTRILLTIAGLSAIVGVVVVRDLFGGGVPGGFGIGVVLGLGILSIGYEAMLLVMVGERLRRGEPMPRLAWSFNAVAEALFPTFVLTIATLMPSIGPFRALVIPAVYLYFLAMMVATLRLRPLLCIVSGAVSAAGYLGLVAWTYLAFDAPAGAAATHPAVYGSGAAFMVIGGLVSGGVARQIRCHVALALKEAAERQKLIVAARDTLIFGLAKLAEYRDTDTGTHLERISEYTAVLADALRRDFPQIGDDWIQTLRVASSMHDIGKVGIPDRVLQKPGRLDDDERKVMQEHPGIGSETLRAIRQRAGAGGGDGADDDPLLAMSGEIAIAHHERWDGAGYPNRTAGDAIALSARIIAVADVYDALTSARVYKQAMSHAEARRIIREGRGTQFDPAVVDAFDRIEACFDEVRRRHHGKVSG